MQAAKAEVIPMGVQHCEAMKNTQSELETTILFIGRLTEIKGVDVLLKAVQQIDGAQLLIAGEGEQKNTLETWCGNLSVNAKFLGQVEATRRNRLLSSCAAIVIPSRVLADGRTEGTPVVCLEAMAAGLPVVASSVGGLAEVIIDDHNGLLFEPENPAMLAEKLKLVSSDAALRRKLSRNAHLTASDYSSWSRIGTRFSELIKGTLENKPNRNSESVALEKSLIFRRQTHSVRLIAELILGYWGLQQTLRTLVV